MPSRRHVLVGLSCLAASISPALGKFQRIPKTIYSGDGFTYYLQAVSADRYQRQASYKGLSLERFELRSGDDHWNGVGGSDDRNHRERCEARVNEYDPVGASAVYRYGLLIPSNYQHMSPQQTLGQWHNGKFDSCFVRLENGKLGFAVNVHKPSIFKIFPIAYTPDRILDLRFEFDWNPGTQGRARVFADGKLIVDYKGILLERRVKQLYFKYGIYRSKMDRWKGPGPAPTLVVYYESPSRRLAGRSGASATG
jgi:hypothetical protein